MSHHSTKRVRVLPGQHAKLGEKMIEWLLHPSRRPKDIKQLAGQLAGIAELDKVLKYVEFIDTPMEVAKFRLPPREMVEASLQRAQNVDIADYGLPDFYGDGADPGLTPLELFQSRIGDYTTGECR